MSEFTQESFAGGMNMLSDDTRLKPNQYRVGFNVRNRYDVLEPILSSKQDTSLPAGIVQELVTFGNYLIVFVSGKAYFRYFTSTGWQQIPGFSMSPTAPRYWTETVPVATTNYARASAPVSLTVTVADANGVVAQMQNILGFAEGNNPGLLVQDNVNQPQFIYLSIGGPVCRVTKTYNDWLLVMDPVTFVTTTDEREYVPIGNVMAWNDGILFIASPDGNMIYRSVTGRPLDFVVNVDTNGSAGGDATTTAYSVGVGGISCMRGLADNSLFVAASNANFLLSKPKGLNVFIGSMFGEPLFDRKFLFNSTCLSDGTILDSQGDTKFIDLTGVRSFNAVQQSGTSQGRNSPFTAAIQEAFKGIVQDANYSAAILFNDYEFYAVTTIFGPAIAVYDTINQCWTSFDLNQTEGKRVKILAKIELAIQRLYAVTEDDKLYELYAGPGYDAAKVRPLSISPALLRTEQGYQADVRGEICLDQFRCVLNRLTQDATVTVTPFVNNRINTTVTKSITFSPILTPAGEVMPDIDTQLSNLLFSFPNCSQGWKTFCMIQWTSGALTQYSYTFEDLSPINPLISQGNTR